MGGSQQKLERPPARQPTDDPSLAGIASGCGIGMHVNDECNTLSKEYESAQRKQAGMKNRGIALEEAP